ncbi:MAG: hypothetical protein V8Q42_09050 [Anaerovoracaceae bacterium]
MDKGTRTPKYRFDEVNEALKKARNRVAVLEEELKQKETETARLRDEIAQVRSSCERLVKGSGNQREFCGRRYIEGALRCDNTQATPVEKKKLGSGDRAISWI